MRWKLENLLKRERHKSMASLLPYEILQRVFRYLFRNADPQQSLKACALVCRAWYYPACYLLHSHPVLLNPKTLINYVQSLEHSISKKQNGFLMVKNLSFEHSTLFKNENTSFLIKVSSCLPAPSMHLDDAILNRIAKCFVASCPPLRVLDLSNCVQLSENSILHLVSAVSETLEVLVLVNCRLIRDVVIRTVSRMCRQLTHLSIRGCGKIGDAALRDVSLFLGSKLEHLDVSGCMRINDPGLEVLGKLSGVASNLSWDPLRVSARKAKLLLNTAKSVNKELESLKLNQTSIARLANAAAMHAQSRAMQIAAEIVPQKQKKHSNLGKLKSLSLAGLRRQSRMGLVKFLEQIIKVHPNLKELEFSIPPPPSTSTKSIFSFGNLLFPILGNLNSLKIRDCEFLDDANLEPIAHCRNLSVLELFNAVNMTQSSFQPIVTLPKLKNLRIRGARYLTDVAMTCLCSSTCAPELEIVDFSDCFELGDESLYMFSAMQITDVMIPLFKNLRHLSIENCRRISFRGIMSVAKALTFPKAKLVSLHVSGAWEGVTQIANVAYRQIPGMPPLHREIHLASLCERGLLRDEFDTGHIGSGGCSLLWSISHAGRPLVPWYCRFVRSTLEKLVHEYSWIPVPLRGHVQTNLIPSIPGMFLVAGPVPGQVMAFSQQPPLTLI